MILIGLEQLVRSDHFTEAECLLVREPNVTFLLPVCAREALLVLYVSI